MANHVKLFADRVEFPTRQVQYSITPPISKLQEGLEAFRALQEDIGLQSQPAEARQEVLRFLRQYGHLLYRTLFPAGQAPALTPGEPLLLELSLDWSVYPWELLHDGDNWLALQSGVVRFLFQPYLMESPRPIRPEGLRVLGISAVPLPVKVNNELARQVEALGTRFITPLRYLLDDAAARSPFRYLGLEHARPEEVEEVLRRAPDVLFFSGFSGEGGWHLESDLGTPRSVTWEWLLTRLRQAAKSGLEMAVLNEASSFLAPMAGTGQTRELLRAGLSAVVRIEGRLARARQQDYARTLARNLAEGYGTAGSHLAAVRRLHRRFEHGWDWSFARLYARGLPPESAPTRAGGEEATLEDPLVRQMVGRPAPAMDPLRGEFFGTRPPPPRFAPRRRAFNRSGILRELAEALQPQPEEKSSLVFLSGGAGSGKTVLGRELVNRLHRQFFEVVWLQERDLLPDAREIAPVEGLNTADPREEWPLVQALARLLRINLLDMAEGLGPERWAPWLRLQVGEQRARLIVLDRLERLPGYEAFCKGLVGLGGVHRVLVLSRTPPPLLPGRLFSLPAVTPEELAHLYGEAFVDTLRHFPDGGLLLRHCCGDLLAARLLRRLSVWPEPGRVRELLGSQEHPHHSAEAGSKLLELLAGAAIETLGDGERRVLGALALFPDLVHEAMLPALTGLEPKDLLPTLSGLQWLGLVEAFEGERYFLLPHRLQGLVAARLLTRQAMADLEYRIQRAYHVLLAEIPGRLSAEGGAPLPMEAWVDREGTQREASAWRLWQRLGVERLNLAEVAALLTESKSWVQLERFVSQAAPLAKLPGLGDLWGFLNRCLAAAGTALEDGVLLAQGLTRLAQPLLEMGELDRARMLLERSLELLAPTNSWAIMGETYRLLSRCHTRLGNLDAAHNLLLSALELGQQLGDPEALVAGCLELETLYLARGLDPAQAEPMFQPHLEILERSGNPVTAARLKGILGRMRGRAMQLEAAEEMLQSALETLRLNHATEFAGEVMMDLADTALRAGQADAALKWWRMARALESVRVPGGRQQTLIREVCALFEPEQDRVRQLETWLELRMVLERSGNPTEMLEVLDRIGGLYYQMGEREKSTQYYQERMTLQNALG